MSRFDAMYEGTPPWEIGRPQSAIARLASEGGLVSPILDVGCGTGENALHLASLGHEVLGVDVVAGAIAQARQKARDRNIAASFEVADALDLERLGRTFETVVDSAVFHVFDDAERARFVASLARVLRPGGRYFTLVFSEREPAGWGGPRRIRRDEIESAFGGGGWIVRSIQRDRLETRIHAGGGEAWLAYVERT